MFRNSQSAEEKAKSGVGRKRTVLQRTRGELQHFYWLLMFRNSQSAEEKVKSGGGRKRTWGNCSIFIGC